MESFMLDICQILLILIEIWKIQKESQLYAICLGTARYFLFKYLTKSELFVAKLVVNPSQIYALMQNVYLLIVFLYYPTHINPIFTDKSLKKFTFG